MTRYSWVAFVSVVAALAMLGLLVTPAAARSVEIRNQVMEGSLAIQPGDVISAGYVLRVYKPHAALTVRVVNAKVLLPVSCTTTGTVKGTIEIPLVDGTYTVAADDGRWLPSDDWRLDKPFQGSAVAPDLCRGKAMYNGSAVGPGATFVADLQATDTRPQVEIKFHYRDPRASGYGNINCALGGQQNPNATVACRARWSASLVTTAGPIPLPTPGNDAQLHEQVNGVVFDDRNGNGVQDKDEAGIPGVTIEVYDATSGALVGSMKTLNIGLYVGYYNIVVPVTGVYRVRELDLPGYVSTTPNEASVTVPVDGAATVYFGDRLP